MTAAIQFWNTVIRILRYIESLIVWFSVPCADHVYATMNDRTENRLTPFEIRSKAVCFVAALQRGAFGLSVRPSTGGVPVCRAIVSASFIHLCLVLSAT